MKGIDFSVCNEQSASFVIDTLKERFGFKVLQPYHGLIWAIRADFIHKQITYNNRFEPYFENIIVDGNDSRSDMDIIMSSMEKFKPSGLGVFHNKFRRKPFENHFEIRSFAHDLHIDLFKPRLKIYSETEFKDMKITKTEKLEVNGKKREVTLVVLNDGKTLKAGYSVRVPGDKRDEELGIKIATGRANSPKTNVKCMSSSLHKLNK